MGEEVKNKKQRINKNAQIMHKIRQKIKKRKIQNE